MTEKAANTQFEQLHRNDLEWRILRDIPCRNAGNPHDTCMCWSGEFADGEFAEP